MALLHEATISPRKDELVGPWLRTKPWWDGETERAPIGSFRLDDPAGGVGMECFLFGSASGSTLFVPVTYRDAPMPGPEVSLLGTMEHSVLGTRSAQQPVHAERHGDRVAEQRREHGDRKQRAHRKISLSGRS